MNQDAPAGSPKQDLRSLMEEMDGVRREMSGSVTRGLLWSLAISVVLANIAFFAFRSPFALIAILIPLVFVGIHASSKGAEWTRLYKARVIAAYVEQSGDFRYSPNEGITEEEFTASRLFQRSVDRYNSEDLIEGKQGSTALRFSDVHAEYKTTSTDSKGRTQTHWHTIFKGLFVIADFNKDFLGITLVLPDSEERAFGRLGQWFQGLAASAGMQPGELIKLEDPEFEKAFKVYSTDQVEARYILSTSLMRRILDFAHAAETDVRMAFLSSCLRITIANTADRFTVPSLFCGTRAFLDPHWLADYANDIQFATSIVGALDLNTRIWSKK